MAFTTSHLGFGVFRLADLLPGEAFIRSDGSLGQVCTGRPKAAEHVEVWIDCKTTTARRVFLHSTARVFGTSWEQARRIFRRVQARERRAKQKGARAS